jgi:hypothetical protein
LRVLIRLMLLAPHACAQSRYRRWKGVRVRFLEVRMSALGQKAKCSLRANVFRCSPKTGHRSMQSACPFGADCVAKLFSQHGHKFSEL